MLGLVEAVGSGTGTDLAGEVAKRALNGGGVADGEAAAGAGVPMMVARGRAAEPTASVAFQAAFTSMVGAAAVCAEAALDTTESMQRPTTADAPRAPRNRVNVVSFPGGRLRA